MANVDEMSLSEDLARLTRTMTCENDDPNTDSFDNGWVAATRYYRGLLIDMLNKNSTLPT